MLCASYVKYVQNTFAPALCSIDYSEITTPWQGGLGFDSDWRNNAFETLHLSRTLPSEGKLLGRKM